MSYSTAVPQIVTIVRTVVKFHPLLTVTSFICQVILLQVWIEQEVSNQWKALKVYCQSTMRALLDPIIEKMKNLSKSLQMHLNHEAEKGQPKTKLIGRIAIILLVDTELCSKYDKRGVKMQLLLLAGLELLTLSKLRSQLRILRKYHYAANSTSNCTFFVLALVFAKFYDNSLRSLSSMLFIVVYLLYLLIVLRSPIDFGLFSFIIRVIGSITYNLFQLTSPSWIIASICFVLFSFKNWLDKYWLDLKEDQSLISTNTTVGSTSVFFILSSTVIHIVGAFYASSTAKSPLSNYKDWSARVISSVIWNVQVNKKDTSLPSTNTKEISSLILTIVNVAQGMFIFVVSFIMCPMGNYKDWLFALINYVVFCFWLRSFCPRDLLAPPTKTKGITGMILYLQYVATNGIMVLVGFEPRLYYRDWLIIVTCYVLWWVRLHPSTKIEFKVLQWWAVVVDSTVAEVIYWTI